MSLLPWHLTYKSCLPLHMLCARWAPNHSSKVTYNVLSFRQNVCPYNKAILLGKELLILLVIARPKGGLFRYHVKRIHFTMQGFGFLSAILRQNWWPCTTTTEVPPLFNLARFDLNKDCCWKNYLQTGSDYFSHSICSFINCISIEITIQLNL